ncbi:MAG: DUF362 domain-containing protein [Pirellulaceae bacterium]|jgi:uncharacterized protein (DUF362 family)|nr:DUF362 domain-containing protein [Pirellulaceae bacterium]MDP7015090.1 DUF362 domain-containing protein [Pirellulaceae bacterium]
MSQFGSPSQLDRRSLLLGGSVAAAGLIGYPLAQRLRWRAPVFVARNQSYAADLQRVIEDGLRATGIQPSALRKKRVLLKPNLVEPTRDAPQITTHPAVVQAAAAVFSRWGAAVQVGEGPGHVRDSQLVLDESGMGEMLRGERIEFADLNYEETAWRENRGGASDLEGFHFPRSVLEADLVVSMPKMKTHHWVGVTCAMKNLYGVIPGIRYGWPKNVLHFGGIPQTVYDINASLPPTIAIVDGIECMEGDGPIMGAMKPMGVLLVGANATAVDATACRLMRVRPDRINYLRLAGNQLGPLDAHRIPQVGESLEPLAQPFQILDRPHLRGLAEDDGVMVS